MAHEHAQAHRLVRRQRGPVETVVAVEIVTVPSNGGGRVQQATDEDEPPRRTLVPPAVRPQPSSTEDDDEPEETTTRATATRRPVQTTAEASGRETRVPSSARETTTPSLRVQSTLLVATKAPTPSSPLSSVVGVVGVISATASSTISAGPSASSAATESEGMSGGAKAGLALGILLGVAALLVGILMFYRHKKNKMAGEDNEKIGMHSAPPPPPAQVQTGAAPAAAANRFPATAPRLELRPESQFSPTLEQRKSGANALNAAAAAGAMAQTKKLALSTEEKSPTASAWERRGAANASADPFHDDSAALAATPRSQQNPFGNSAALDSNQSSIPDSPLNSSPAHSSTPSADLAKPAPAPAAALAAAASVAAITSAQSNQDLPPTSNANAASEGLPAIPAGTDNIPASPGPAPTGPPPPVGAMAGGRPNGPPSGPNNVHRVTLDFKPSMGDELELKAGSLVRMLHEYDDGWALCITMDRSQQGVVPRTCLSKHPVKPRTGPPRQGPPPPHMRGNPPIRSPMGPGGIPQPQRPMSPAEGSPHPPALSPASGRMSPGPRAMSPGPRQMASPQMQQGPRGRSNSNAPYARPQRSMSPGPYGGGPQMAPPSQMGRPRSNSANQAMGPRRGPAPGPSPMNPNTPMVGAVPSRKPVPGQAL